MADAGLQTETGLSLKPSRRKGWIAGGIAVIVVLGVGTAVTLRAVQAAPGIPTTDIYKVTTGTQVTTITTTGTVESSSQSNVAFQNVSGTIKTLKVDVGAHVKAGQILATLDDSSIRAQMEAAQAGVMEAQGNLLQAQARLDLAQEGPTPQTIQVAQAGVKTAQTALENAQKAYEDALANYNDRTAQQQQLVAAQNQVTQAKAALETAQQNQQAAIQAAQNALQAAQAKLQTDQQNLQTDQAQYGNITLQQIQQEYQEYQDALSHFQAWQHGGFAGQNPYQQPLQAAQQVYESDSQGYYKLQGDQNAVKADQAAVAQAQQALTQAQSSVSNLQAQYQAALNALQTAQQAYDDRTPQQAALDQAANAVKQAQAQVQTAEAQLQQVLHPQSPGNIEAAKAGVATAQAGVQAAQAQLHQLQVQDGYTVLRAPADGVITAKNAAVGDVVQPGQTVFTMDVTDLQVFVAVSEAQLQYVEVGDPISMTISALPGKTFTGKVFEIDPRPINGTTGITEYRVKATLENASSDLVKPGMSGNVVIHTNLKHEGVMIPAMSLQNIDGYYGVYEIRQKGAKAIDSGAAAAAAGVPPVPQSVLNQIAQNLPPGVYFQPVQVGYKGSTQVQITAGLRPGDEILLGGSRFIVQPDGTQPQDSDD
ncbi:MAG: efflux RND transporter periplasmic adaptor subunit [Alicyclobacillus macrosporangiidus]|uniref:efflux RND transporter periplasmic adaptor subunit n=1 Tax=Alicyclobacillus macrosporangiidus TaxID=392015 RepID=UPI0026EF2FCD|nr:efflux RND transporter periplasmic adaptor subunit [Alicyclobacillus macrosporangiidus]MCL6600059.1 efflux RND transporter periplasmic adaptor subunit [Alicyclobacillus macrosporangiidus]